MKINTEDFNKWYAAYSELKDDKKVDYLINTLNRNLIDEFFKEANMEDIILDTMYSLKKYKDHEQMVALYNCSQKYKHLFHSWYHLDGKCIDYYLYTGDAEGIRKHLIGFLEQVVDSIDFFIPVLDKVMYYGYRDLALEVSLNSYGKVKGADGLVSGAEQDFFKIIYIEKLYAIFTDIKSSGSIDRNAIIEYFEKYDYKMEDWELDRMQYIWSDNKPKAYSFEDFVKNKKYFANDILYMFLRYADSKNVSFAAAYDIWDIGFNSFKKNFKEAQESKSFDSIFALDEEEYENEISGRINELFSNQVTVSFAVAWGMEYMYDFLNAHGFISDEVYEDALIIMHNLKNDIIINRANDMWQYNFINKWDKPDSISDKEYEEEKDFFEDSFSSFIVMVEDDTFENNGDC